MCIIMIQFVQPNVDLLFGMFIRKVPVNVCFDVFITRVLIMQT